MGVRRILNKIARIIFHLLAITFLGWVFWAKVYRWVYAPGFAGWDTPQFIYYVFYYLRHPGWPQLSWDHLWFMGMPRVLDMTFLHFYLIQPLVANLGVWLAVKIYPLISAFLFVFFSYCLFYFLSRSIFFATGLALTVVLSESLFYPLFGDGIVLSFISQAALPATLFFLVRFYQTGNRRHFWLGVVTATLGIYSHGGNQLFFGLVPSLIFLLLATKKGERMITSQSLINAFIFGLGVFFLGALGIWPQLEEALKAGSYGTAPLTGFEAKPTTFRLMWELTHKGVWLIFASSLILGFFALRKKRLKRETLPLGALLVYFFVWNLTGFLGINPLIGFLFTSRTLWFLLPVAGAVSATLLGSFFVPESREKFRLRLVANFAKAIFLTVCLLFALPVFSGVKYEKINGYVRDSLKDAQNDLAYVAAFIKPDSNYRIWSHGGTFNNSWGMVYDMPLVEGYFHFYTKEAEPWQGWFYGTISRSNWLSGEIPPQMAKAQSLFFIDWYGVKYFVTEVGSDFMDIAPHFYNGNDYIARKKVESGYPGLLEVADKFTSPIVVPVKTPVIGFIGADTGYQAFLKDIALLNLKTDFLIPVKLGKTIGAVSLKKLALVDALVIYDFPKGGFSYAKGWQAIYNFVQKGGKVWIETGGNSGERESSSLPAVFPVTTTRYGSLERTWQPGGELAGEIDFSSLEPLVYRGTPWQVSYAPQETVKPGAKVLLTQKGYPVAVEQNIGEGKVIWTGVNFWYRPEEYRKNGMEEIKPLKLFLEELLGELPPVRVEASLVRLVPEKVWLAGEGISGVVFKENYSSGWQAIIEAGGEKRRLPILIAGPGLMYVDFPEEVKGEKIELSLDYRGESVHHLAFWVSLASGLMMIDLVIGSFVLKHLIPTRITKFPQKILLRISRWWRSEEE